MSRDRLGPGLALILTALVAGCIGGTSPAPSPPLASPTPSLANETPTPTPSPSPTPTPTTAPSPSAPVAGLQTGRVVIASQGFAVTLPAGWARVDLSGGIAQTVVDAIARATGRSTADARLSVETLRAILPAGVELVAYDLSSLSPTGTFASNINVLRIPGGSQSLDQIERLSVAQLDALDVIVKPVDHVRQSLASGEAIRLTYGFRVGARVIPGGIVQTTQYILVHGAYQFVITLSTAGPPTPATQADFAAIADSIEFLP